MSRWPHYLLLTTLLLLAAVLRMGWPSLAQVRGDEARLLALAWNMADGRTLPLHGLNPVPGWPNFPTTVWLYALPLLVWGHVYAAVLWTGLLNTAAIGLTYWLVRRYWGWSAAFTAAFLLAVSPWSVLYGRQIGAPALLLPLVVAWAICAALALAEQRPRCTLPLLVCAAVACQIHPAAISLAVATVVLLLLFARRVAWRWVAGGVGAAVLLSLPVLYGGAGSLPPAAPSAGGGGNSLIHAAQLTTGWQLHTLAGPTSFDRYLASFPPLLMPLIWVVWGMFVLGGVVYVAGLVWQGRKDNGADPAPTVALILLVWLGAAVGTSFWLPAALPNLLPLYPMPYIAAALFFVWLLPWLRWRGWAILLVSGAGQVWAVGLLLSFVAQNATPGGWGTPLYRPLQAAVAAEQWLANTGAAEVLIAGPTEDPQQDEFVALFDLLLRDVPHRFVNINRSAVFPQQAAVVLLQPAPAPLMDLYATAATAERTIPLRPGEGFYTLLTLPPTAAPVPAQRFNPAPLLANAAFLAGYDLPPGTADLRLYWQVGTPSPTAVYYFFTAVQDARGTRLAQTDWPTFGAAQWRPQDQVVSRFVLQDLEKGLRPLTIRLGMYHYPSLEPVPVLDTAANTSADAAEIIVP